MIHRQDFKDQMAFVLDVLDQSQSLQGDYQPFGGHRALEQAKRHLALVAMSTNDRFSVDRAGHEEFTGTA